MKQLVLPSTLGNLVRTLAYHRHQQDMVRALLAISTHARVCVVCVRASAPLIDCA